MQIISEILQHLILLILNNLFHVYKQCHCFFKLHLSVFVSREPSNIVIHNLQLVKGSQYFVEEQNQTMNYRQRKSWI